MFETDHQIVKVVLAGTVLILFFATMIFWFVYAYRKKHTKYLVEKAQLQAQFQQELLRTQLEIQEQTFKTISQEIHDNIGQMLSLAKLNLNTVDLQKQAQAGEKISTARDLVSKTIQDLRDLSKTLNTETITTVGLLSAIEAELHLLQKTGTLQTTFSKTGTPVRLDPQKQLILFRIVQEALHNVMKHAQAAAICVEAAFEPEQFRLLIVDNGRGFEGTAPSTFGSSLRNMQNRSRLIGAAWQIESAAGSGTTIRITLPYNA
jgi:signal transduction histidine kinase